MKKRPRKTLRCFYLLALLTLSISSFTCRTATQTSTPGWRFEWIDQTQPPLHETPSRTCSITTDTRGQPHIAFGRQVLFYATRTADGWETQVVDDEIDDSVRAKIVLDKDDKLHVGYSSTPVGIQNWYDNDVRYASYDGTSWDIQEVVEPGLGDDPIMALDTSDRPVFIYKEQKSLIELVGWQYLTWDGSSWQNEALSFIQGLVLIVSLEFDQDDNPWIAYSSDGSYWTNIIVAHRGETGWQVQEVHRFLTERHVGEVSLAVDTGGYPHVAFYESGNSDLMYAYWDGVNWQLEVVDGDGFVGSGATLALDSSNRAHIAYYDATNDVVKYAFHDGQGWQFETITTEFVMSSTLSLALDAWDGAHLAFLNEHYQARYAYHSPR